MSFFRQTTADAEERQTRLTELENRIERARYHMAAAAEAGDALTEIRDQQLYRLTHAAFEQYVSDRWKMTKQSAYELMAAARVLRTLAGTMQQPTSIKQAIALAQLPEDQMQDAWQETLDASPLSEDGTPQPTGEIAAAIAAKRSPRKKKAKPPKPTRLRIPGATITIARNKTGATKSDAELLAAAIATLDARRAAAA